MFKNAFVLGFVLCFVCIPLTQFTGWHGRVPAEILLALGVPDAFQRVTIVTLEGDVSPGEISISFNGLFNTLDIREFTSDL